jgi:bifunctional DNA primase/polymerase-like protein
LLNFTRADTLYQTAERYLSLGWSVIPLYGDAAPDRPKLPAVPWKAYQTRRASLSEARHWFTEQGFQALGIVTGSLSNLVVLDFDSLDLFQAFAHDYPYLVEGPVIQTRRGCHLYFKPPPARAVSTRKEPGIDRLSDGCYVVAPPSSIGGFHYTPLQNRGTPTLTALDLACINLFLDEHHSRSPVVHTPIDQPAFTRARVTNSPPSVETHSPALPSPSLGDREKEAGGAVAFDPLDFANRLFAQSLQREHPLAKALRFQDLPALYRAQLGEGRGRNQALFYTAITARDHGWSPADVRAALADLHIRTRSADHAHETDHQRQREAERTLQSAFSRPARPPQSRPIQCAQLPTRARETLYALKLTCVVRVIEGLRAKGLPPGQLFTRKQARLLLLGLVGRDSIDHALHALAPSGQPLFERAQPSLEPTPASDDAAAENPQTEFKKCFFEGAQKSGQIQRGRKSHLFILPSNTELCRKLGIQRSSSDPFQPDDLTSAKKTRQAAHRELIRRRPGQYHRSWLAKRLGVSIRTLQGYNHALQVQVSPVYHQQPITWTTLNLIPDFPMSSLFLQDENQRRYPAQREIAARLLARGHSVTLLRQQANHYRLEPPPITPVQRRQIEQTQQAQHERLEHRIAVEQGRAEVMPVIPVQPPALPRSGLPPPEPPASLPLPDALPPSTPPKPTPAPRLTKRRARQPLPNAYEEGLAQRIYHVINNRTPDPGNRISQASARRCVFTYGPKRVIWALGLMQSRHSVTKPAGFFMTVLRSESKGLLGAH